MENSISSVAIGRKNYLFAGSHDAAQRGAMMYSLLSTCKAHGIDPYAWQKDILEKLPTQPINRIKELLPQYYKIIIYAINIKSTIWYWSDAYDSFTPVRLSQFEFFT